MPKLIKAEKISLKNHPDIKEETYNDFVEAIKKSEAEFKKPFSEIVEMKVFG